LANSNEEFATFVVSDAVVEVAAFAERGTMHGMTRGSARGVFA
jgi:hypothetical protein